MAFKIGTSGYSYEDWRRYFYPEKITRDKMLDYYAERFDTVEINTTYYGIPKLTTCQRWADKTPEGFEFIVKTHRETTHTQQNFAESMRDLIGAVRPLVDMRKLSGFLGQFPYSFKNTPSNREYLKKIKELCGVHTLFVEFRNWTWNQPEVYDFLTDSGISYVNVDQPQLRGLLPAQNILTTDRGYIRFHGRNGQNWWDGTNVTRYNYNYNEQELNEWLPRIAHLLKSGLKTYIFFNNHPQGKAALNALLLKEMLENESITQ